MAEIETEHYTLREVTETSKRWLGRAIKYTAIGLVALGVLEIATGNLPLGTVGAKLGHGLHVVGCKLSQAGHGLHHGVHEFNEGLVGHPIRN